MIHTCVHTLSQIHTYFTLHHIPPQDLEEDPELRQRINIYKDKDAIASLQQKQQQQATGGGPQLPAGLQDDEMSEGDDEDELPEVPYETPHRAHNGHNSRLLLFLGFFS